MLENLFSDSVLQHSTDMNDRHHPRFMDEKRAPERTDDLPKDTQLRGGRPAFAPRTTLLCPTVHRGVAEGGQAEGTEGFWAGRVQQSSGGQSGGSLGPSGALGQQGTRLRHTQASGDTELLLVPPGKHCVLLIQTKVQTNKRRQHKNH